MDGAAMSSGTDGAKAPIADAPSDRSPAPNRTPGPWHCKALYDAGDRYQVFWADGPSRVRRLDKWSSYTHADASLIAAAPDLLEAAKDALRYLEGREEEWRITIDCADLLRNAIAKGGGHR